MPLLLSKIMSIQTGQNRAANIKAWYATTDNMGLMQLPAPATVAMGFPKKAAKRKAQATPQRMAVGSRATGWRADPFRRKISEAMNSGREHAILTWQADLMKV